MKLIALVLSIILSFIALPGCTKENTHTQNVKATEISYQVQQNQYTELSDCIFEGSLPFHKKSSLKPVDFSFLSDYEAILNNNENITWKYRRGNWKINLDEFYPIGITDSDSIIFTSDEKANVIISKKDNNIMVFAKSWDLLDPHSYKTDDFELSYANYVDSLASSPCEDVLDKSLLSTLWDQHLNTKAKDAHAVCDGKYCYIGLNLKNIPGLTYEFSFIEGGDEYLLDTPWVQSFSYENVLKYYPINTPGAKHRGFINTEYSPISTSKEAIELAENERTLEYDQISVSYDFNNDIWAVDFGTSNLLGGNQTVFINGDGKTILCIYGE